MDGQMPSYRRLARISSRPWAISTLLRPWAGIGPQGVKNGASSPVTFSVPVG
jgi:hypothetical protein